MGMGGRGLWKIEMKIKGSSMGGFYFEELESQQKTAPTECSICKKPLLRLRWNTKGDLLVCDTEGCLRFRQPQGFIYKHRQMTDIFGRERKRRKRGKGKEMKNDTEQTS